MDLDICIAYNQDPAHLSDEYNKYCDQAKDWVCLIDHDAMFLHPKWHFILLRAIKKLGKQMGFGTCLTNRIGHGLQRAKSDSLTVPAGHDIQEHKKFAIDLEIENRGKYNNCEDTNPLSGVIMLTHKEVWKKIGGFVNVNRGILSIDNNYFRKVVAAGYSPYILQDTYVYHGYQREWKRKGFKEWLQE